MLNKFLVVFALAFLAFFAPARAQTYDNCDTGTCATGAPAHPVFMVHGVDGAITNFGTMTTYLTGRGWTENTDLFRIDMDVSCSSDDYCVEVPGHDSGTLVFESYARCLAAYIDLKAPCVAGVCPTIDLVGHSAGGLVSRYYAKFLANRSVDTLVTIATPNQGTTNACPGSCAGRSEMCDDTTLMLALNGETDLTLDETPGGSVNGPTHYATVFSEADLVVVPYCSAMLITNPSTYDASNMTCSDPPTRTNATMDTADDTAQCGVYNGSALGTGHTSMLSLANVHKHVCNNLRQGD